MKLLPKVPFSGRLCRLKSDWDIATALRRNFTSFEIIHKQEDIEGTKWQQFWLQSRKPLSSIASEAPDEEGFFQYPFVIRAAHNRFILASREAILVEKLLEYSGVGDLIDYPRVNVDKLARELVFPSANTKNGIVPGRKYAIGAVYGAVEGYARALRTVSFFGDDIAEAELFRYALQQIIITRIGLRDPVIDKELLSISSTGSIDFQYRGAQHLNAIDQLTSFMRLSGYIEWRTGRTWSAETDIPLTQQAALGNDQNL